MTRIWNKPQSVLIFNRWKTLVSIVSSVNEAAKMMKLHPGNISKVCKGQLMSLNSFYFRYIGDDIELELKDIGTLRLEDYDQLCGIDRTLYATSKMNRKNWKYKKRTKNEDKSI